METLEFITIKNSSFQMSFFLQNFKSEDKYPKPLDVNKIIFLSFLNLKRFKFLMNVFENILGS